VFGNYLLFDQDPHLIHDLRATLGVNFVVAAKTQKSSPGKNPESLDNTGADEGI